jgi:hypothetical protein
VDRTVIDEVKRNLSDPVALVARLGLDSGAVEQDRGVLIRCPLHEDSTPSCSVRTESDGTISVWCFAGCDFGGGSKGGDALALVALAFRLDPRRDFRKVLEMAAEMGGVRLEELARPRSGAHRRSVPVARGTAPRSEAPEERRPPLEELKKLWAASARVDRIEASPHPSDRAVVAFMARRGIWPPELAALDVARVLPLPDAYAWPAWWPEKWARTWRLAILAYEPYGRARSLHARAVRDGIEAKTLWPKGCSMRGLLFADAAGQALMRGKPPPSLDGVIVVEGLTDFLATCLAMSEAGRSTAVLGGTAGSFAALSEVSWPEGCPAFVATDEDPTGERYAAEVRAALPSADVRRVRLARQEER